MTNAKTAKIKDQAVEEATPEEEILFTSLRASDWSEFYGQKNVKESLKIAISAAKKRKEAIDVVARD